MAKILIVDDESSILFATRDYLTACGHEVDAADALEDAKEMFLRERYELVIADLRLSGSSSYDGLELLDVVRRARPGTPFVLLTAYGSADVQATLLARGASALVHKPTPLAELARLATELVESAR
jgi:DNA-binding response OmpR family regulator